MSDANNNTILAEGLLQAAEATPEQVNDPVEESALFINAAHTQFKKIAYALAKRKKNSVARVLQAVLFEPLEKVELQGKEEEQLFDICQQVMQHKGVVLNYAFARMESIKKGELNEQQEK